MRTNQDKVIITEFAGCNNVIDKVKLPPAFASWSHGGLFNQRGEFQRLKGKQALSNSSSTGLVLGLQQLDFAGRTVMAVQHGTTITAVDDLSLFRTTTETMDILEPFIP